MFQYNPFASAQYTVARIDYLTRTLAERDAEIEKLQSDTACLRHENNVSNRVIEVLKSHIHDQQQIIERLESQPPDHQATAKITQLERFLEFNRRSYDIKTKSDAAELERLTKALDEATARALRTEKANNELLDRLQAAEAKLEWMRHWTYRRRSP